MVSSVNLISLWICFYMEALVFTKLSFLWEDFIVVTGVYLKTASCFKTVVGVNRAILSVNNVYSNKSSFLRQLNFMKIMIATVEINKATHFLGY